MSDIWTMIWKESKDLISQGGRAQLIRPLIMIGVVGVALPLRLGPQWLDLMPLVLLILLYVPFITIISFIGDAVAGFPNLGLSLPVGSLGMGVALFLGLTAGFIPAFLAYRARVTELLRQV